MEYTRFVFYLVEKLHLLYAHKFAPKLYIHVDGVRKKG